MTGLVAILFDPNYVFVHLYMRDFAQKMVKLVKTVFFRFARVGTIF